MPEPPLIKSEKLSAAGFTHGFFTRHGGTSSGNFASLNCSYSVGDAPDCVTANLERVSGHLNLERTNLVTVSQVHGATVEDFDARGLVQGFQTREADALTSLSPQVGLGVRTADCVPILIGCRETGRAAAIHAGWKGLVAQVIGRTVAMMLRDGGHPRTLVACIGPHIGQSAFEVSAETAQRLQAAAPSGAAAVSVAGGKPHVDLGQIAASQLAASGINLFNIENLQICTYLNGQTFFSYRRDGKTSGRHLNVICPRQGAQ
jgi:YfiH family protein